MQLSTGVFDPIKSNYLFMLYILTHSIGLSRNAGGQQSDCIRHSTIPNASLFPFSFGKGYLYFPAFKIRSSSSISSNQEYVITLFPTSILCVFMFPIHHTQGLNLLSWLFLPLRGKGLLVPLASFPYSYPYKIQGYVQNLLFP